MLDIFHWFLQTICNLFNNRSNSYLSNHCRGNIYIGLILEWYHDIIDINPILSPHIALIKRQKTWIWIFYVPLKMSKKPIHSPIAKKYDIVLVLFVEKCFYQEYVLECDHRLETSRRHTESGVYFWRRYAVRNTAASALPASVPDRSGECRSRKRTAKSRPCLCILWH